MSHIQIETTFHNLSDAKKIIDILLDKKLIACGQCFLIDSVYSWQNKIENEKEILVKLKTKKELYGVCQKVIKENHKYKVPQIIYYTISGDKDYLSWIDEVTAP